MGNLVKETPHSEMNATIEVFDRLGATREHFTRMRKDAEYAKGVVAFMLRGVVTASASQQLAQALLGQNMVGGVEEWAAFHGVVFTKRQVRIASAFPWDESVLNAPCPFYNGKLIRETHVGFLGVEKILKKPVNILALQELYPASVFPQFCSYAPSSWYSTQKFAIEVTLRFRWYLMLKDIVPGSESKIFDDQQKMLPPEYKVPFAVENITKDLLTAKKQGAFPNPNRYGRCRDLTSNGHRVYVGVGDANGLDVYGWWVGKLLSDVGVSASRKLPS